MRAGWVGAWLLLVAAGCGGGRDCDRYAEVTCEKACGCSPNDPGCDLVWGPNFYDFMSRADCESTLEGICEEEDGLDPNECVEMVEAMACAGATFVHPMCELEPGGGGGGIGPEVIEVTAPEVTPLSMVAIRGRTDEATRVVVQLEDGDRAQVGPVTPGGEFCLEMELPAGARSTFLVSAVAEDGDLSPSVAVDVTHDAGAAEPPDPTCESGGECLAEEDCANDVDDDCNGFADVCDPGCNGCQDDALEPNDVPFDVPVVEPGTTYEDLWICPCREDWFAFEVQEGEHVNVTAAFDHVQIDIDLKLFTREDAEDGTDVPVASSMTTEDSESIDFTSTGSGTYYLRVYSFRADSSGTYELTVR